MWGYGGPLPLTGVSLAGEARMWGYGGPPPPHGRSPTGVSLAGEAVRGGTGQENGGLKNGKYRFKRLLGG